MPDDIQKTALRLPRDLHTEIHEAAKESERSFNSEIVYRLKRSFAGPEDEEILKIADELSARVLKKKR